MLKKSITYTDYNGESRTEDYYFNLSKAELTEMELSVNGGMTEWLKQIINSHNNAEIVKVFKTMILKSYGEKSTDGKRFIKSAELREAFEQTEAYSELFMELLGNEEKAIEFVNGIIPNDIEQKVQAQTLEAKMDVVKND